MPPAPFHPRKTTSRCGSRRARRSTGTTDLGRILYLHGFASGPASGKARYFRSRLPHLEILEIAPRFEKLTITGQLAVIERAAAGEPVSLIGSSLGGYLSALYAARHTEVERVVLLAPAFEFAKRYAERIGAVEMDRWRETGCMDVYHYVDNRNRALGYQLIEDAVRYEGFPDFHQPALIFHGSQDDVVPAALSRQFASTHPNAQLEILDSGHDLHNVLDHMGDRTVAFFSLG